MESNTIFIIRAHSSETQIYGIALAMHTCVRFFRIGSSDSQIKDPAENRNPHKNKHIYLSIEATNKFTTYIKTQEGRIPSLRYAVYCRFYRVIVLKTRTTCFPNYNFRSHVYYLSSQTEFYFAL